MVAAPASVATVDIPLTLGWLVRLLGAGDTRIARFRWLGEHG